MKLSNLTVIFIIIFIPVILIFSYYISMQIDTVNMQASYNAKLLDATKTAVEAFEINTVEWNSTYSSVESSKRRDVMASINTFMTSFANSTGIAGANKERIMAYVPAIVFTLYDGYYIYSPTEVKQIVKDEKGQAIFMSEDLKDKLDGFPETDIESNEGKILYEPARGGGNEKVNIDGVGPKSFTLDPDNAKTDYTYVLKPFATYSERYVKEEDGIDIVVDYTLDNYITIRGTIDGGATKINKSGYLIDSSTLEILKAEILEAETLKETIWFESLTEPITKAREYPYIYSLDNIKIYFDTYNVNEPFIVNADGTRTNLSDLSSVKDKKIITSIKSDGTAEEGYKHIEKSDPEWDRDYSASNYYWESKIFSDWVHGKLGGLTIEDMQRNQEGLKQIYGEEADTTNLYGNETLCPFKDGNTDIFSDHRRAIIKQTLISNLNQAITSYSRNGSAGTFELPILTEEDWDKILNNVSIITFVQNIPIGMKSYNNYVVATSTANKEFVNPDEIYFDGVDGFYHLPYCDKIRIPGTLTGYRNIDYLLKSYEEGSNIKYYSNHLSQACYYCLVQRNLFESVGEDTGKWQLYKNAYDRALARERYVTHEFKNE